jgi:hypothetical protein
LWDGDSRQNADDRNNDHQLDQRETFTELFHLDSPGIGGDSALVK